MNARKPNLPPDAALCPRTLRHCANVLRITARVNVAWSEQRGTSKRTAGELLACADDQRAHADSFDIQARRIERATRKAAKR